MLYSINPANNKLISSYEEYDSEQIKTIIKKAHQRFLHWSETDFNLRKELLENVAKILRNEIKKFSELITLEMGKPIQQSFAEVEKCAWVCEYYADNGEKFLSDEIVKTDFNKSYISFQPLGIVLAIMPWNFPFWQVFRFAAPTLMAGNTCILKHASNVSGCALTIEEIFLKAGFPENCFNTVLINSSRIEEIISSPLVQAVSLTGSVFAGASVAQLSGKYIKKTLLELGGSDPYVVLKDADLDLAVETCVNSRLINGGQSCIAAKRFIVEEDIYNDFVELYSEKLKSKKMGDPFDENNDLGPQANVKLRDELHSQVVESISKGAVLKVGGYIPDGEGAFYPPTLLIDVKPGMPAFDDEIFGPVASVIKAKDENDAINLANHSVFGLGAAIFTNDVEKGELIAKKKLRAGSCFVNAFVRSDPRLPFGGIQQSGYGRELSIFGIREFVNIKTVVVK
ncbi:MAG: NAD-dependent succinate-semialdehyde dehydrogenase [Ignavibacterium sp.]|nr:NAD-dependent succinate-semialdehyde dehydrogenase [Ignavibacterium sp.]MDW8374321.1 NAD-dependent succinate-semialdehyde dehydrogenase [Ignavibacteriales bacterium]